VSFEGASGQLELARFSDSRRWLQSRFVSFQDTQSKPPRIAQAVKSGNTRVGLANKKGLAVT